MNLGNFVKMIQNIMRGDSGINGDAQRIEQLTWILFLKIYDAKEISCAGEIGLSTTKAASH